MLRNRRKAKAFSIKLKEVKNQIGTFANNMLTSASLQLDESADFRLIGIPGSIFGSLFLSKAGYDALGIAQTPANGSFQGGLKTAQSRQNDPPSTQREPGYQGTIHAMNLSAEDDLTYLRSNRSVTLVLFEKTISIRVQDNQISSDASA